MRRKKVLALILAGGAGSRLDVLTQERAKPAMPFGGNYRLIDFALSNCMHSRLTDVWVIEQYQLHSLNEHLRNGRPWDLDQTFGGLLILPPYEAHDSQSTTAAGGFAEGNADAIYRHRQLIKNFAPDLLVVLSADHIYKLDYNDVIEQHLAREADVTMVTTEVGKAKAGRFGVVKSDKDGRVSEFQYKPEKPVSGTVTTEVFVYTTQVLLDTLDRLSARNKQAAQAKSRSAKNNTGEDKDDNSSPETISYLRDFGHELLPELINNGTAYTFPLRGYWRDVGTLRSYFNAHLQLLDETPGLDLDERNWRIHSSDEQRLPARITASARIENSLISDGCRIEGRVVRSVLSPGVHVHAGATIEDSIILSDVVIETKARVATAIVDAETRIGANARVGKRYADVDAVTDEHLTVIGKQARIADNTIIKAGERLKPRARR